MSDTTYKFINEKLSHINKALKDSSIKEDKKTLLQTQKKTLLGIKKFDALYFDYHLDENCKGIASMFPEVRPYLYANHWNDCLVEMDKDIASMFRDAGIYKLVSNYLRDILTKVPDYSEHVIDNFLFLLNRELLNQAKNRVYIKRNMIRWMRGLPKMRVGEELDV